MSDTRPQIPDDPDEWELAEPDELDGANASGFGECVFPGRCCMPSPHFTYECYTAEMAIAQADEENR